MTDRSRPAATRSSPPSRSRREPGRTPRTRRTRRWATLFTLALAPFLAAACGPNGEPEPVVERPPAAVPEAPAADGTRLGWQLPPGWTEETPATNFRLAQARIPGAAGDAELAVFYFGEGQGGGVEANLERWLGQIEPPPGDPEPERQTFEVESEGLTVHTVFARGTLLPSQMGMGPEVEQPGAALLGAVVEGPGGPWFFKATGPAETLAVERGAFLEMLRGLRLARG